jgi:UDP-glucuronate 4-epimerase
MKNFSKTETILVTGVAGFIGFSVAQKLLQAGKNVVGVDSLNNYYDVKLKKARLSVLDGYKNNFSFLKVNFFDTKKFFQKVGKFKIDKIIHLAAQAGVRYSMENPYTYVDTNITGTINIFEFAKRHKIRQVVYASSSSVYGLNKTQPFQENLCVETPISVYAASKKANELFAHVYSHLYDINAIGLRFFTVYGPWGRPDMAYFKFAQKRNV